MKELILCLFLKKIDLYDNINKDYVKVERKRIMNKSKKSSNFKLVVLCIFISLGISFGIILSLNLLNKNRNIERKIIATEKNQITIGEEKILYVDLTKNAEDYEKINQTKEEKKDTDKETIIDKINEDTYNIEFNLEEKSVTIDGKEESISEVINNSEENISNEEIYKYIDENIVGDVEKNESNIKITNPYSTNTILIKTSNIEEIENAGNVQSVVKLSDDLYNIHYLNAIDTKEGYSLLNESDVIENVVKDYKVSILENETEPMNVKALDVSNGKSAWGVTDTGLELYKNKINNAQNIPQIKVAILDTGIRTTHEVFKNKNTADRLELTNSYNYIDNNTDIADDNGHGTMVAGIIAEATSNNVKILPIKVLDSKGEIDLGADSKAGLLNVIEAMSAVAKKVDIINLSLGINEKEIDANSIQILEQAIKRICDSGVIIVCASGNDGEENVYYPASSAYTIAVGATTTNKKITSFSNYGNIIDFVAPGEELTLPYYTGDMSYKDNRRGTSFAAPFIASAIAMIKSENKSYTLEQVKQVLKENSEDLGAIGKDKYYGNGLLNFNINMFSKPLYGDVNNNGRIDPGDFMTLQRHIAAKNSEAVRLKHSTWVLDEEDILIGDINDNKVIDPADIMSIKRYIAAQNSEKVRIKHPGWIILR